MGAPTTQNIHFIMQYTNDILSYFPTGATPRKPQVKILKEVQDALRADKKFLIVHAPTGSGKSHCAGTLANLVPKPPQVFTDIVEAHEILKQDEQGYVHESLVNTLPPFGCYVLTTTKNLQAQYGNLFSNSLVLKGRRNYQCQVDTDFDCEIAPCIGDKKLLDQCLHLKRCPYFNAFEDTLRSGFAVLSYSKFFQMPKFLRRRAIIICDEASGLEEEFVNEFSATIEYTKLLKEGISVKRLTDHKDAHGWINDIVMQLKVLKKDLYEKVFKAKKHRAQEVVNTIKLKYISQTYESLKMVADNWAYSEYIIETDNEKTTLTPLYIDKVTGNIFDFAKHIILMSATIIDHKTFAKSLGITDYKYIEVDSTFDPKKSPIYCPGKHLLNYKNLEQNVGKVVNQALEISNMYIGKCGIVHTYNFKINSAFQKTVGFNKRFLFREHGITNERIIEEHMDRTDGTVLVSPSLGFGTNLSDDLGRFQIVMKLPYLPLGSKRIKALADKDPKWYQMKMLTHLIQMCGRCTRSEEDYSDTYILDGSAVKVLKQSWFNLPEWFKKRLV